MIKLTETGQMSQISSRRLRNYLTIKAENLMNKYCVDSLNDIGCFVVLGKNEYAEFEISKMEFVETLTLGSEVYLHGVKIVSDNYGEDTFLEIEVGEC